MRNEGWSPESRIVALLGSMSYAKEPVRSEVTSHASVDRKRDQLAFLGVGRELKRRFGGLRGIHEAIGRHVNIQPSQWARNRRHFANYFGPFLDQYAHLPLMLQVVPSRKAFRTAVHPVGSEQDVISTQLVGRLDDLEGDRFPVAYGFTMPGALFAATAREEFNAVRGRDRLDLVSVLVQRSIPGTADNTERWFFPAYRSDASRIRKEGKIPALERYFDESAAMQRAPIIRLSVMTPGQGWMQTHSLNISPESGLFLDLRQSRPSLTHFLRSGGHNLNALGTLLFDRTWEGRN